MSATSQRAVIAAPHRLELDRADLAAPREGEVRLRSLAVGICGSDLHVLEGRHPFVSYPVHPGHEVVAEVEAAGPGLEPWLGRRVVLEPSLVCGACRQCRAGRYNVCERLAVMGFQAAGGMAERFVAPIDRLHPVPDGMAVETAALVEPAAVAVHAARMAGSLAGCDVAVVGAGAIGLLCAQVAAAQGAASVRLSDPDPRRVALARALGLDAADRLPERAHDVVFECVGVEGALRAAIAASRKGATVAVVGVYGDDPRVQAGLVQDWELRLQGCLMYTAEDYREAIALLDRGAIDADRMVTDRFALADVESAFAAAARGGETLKVLLLPASRSDT